MAAGVGVLLTLTLAVWVNSGTASATQSSGTTLPAASAAVPVALSGIDLHDGMVLKDGDTYYLYGTRYACGFRWNTATPTNFCGFGVATAPSLAGPWSQITNLFDPNSIDPYNGRTWRDECTRNNNAGCFNPRMVQRSSDGVWILWFNSVADYADGPGRNSYNAMGCAGPAGPCGPGAGAHGSYNKPKIYTCVTNGDFGIFTDGTSAYLICTMTNQTLAMEKLDVWWTNGTGNVAGNGVTNIAGYTASEGPGAYFDSTSGKWVMTLNYDNCGYGSGCGLAYATAPSPLGPWTAPRNWGIAVDSKARATISWNSCGGQPRTVSVVDGVPYQIIDLWVPDANDDSRNQTNAGLLITPLVFRDPPNTPGVPWQPFEELRCYQPGSSATATTR
ncbi:hypothetical protein GA0070564_10329 [Micromonospora mirobrigensis]|uniref:Glycosyl hydrolases family 43 n=2 Tax=Micromonospora mirobrigensis TaxID=262898 RepID=A0A1C4XF96_9ACTN|nr:hypothetical protein GA0070564_10329 [Micromonospora mirobrigensis]